MITKDQAEAAKTVLGAAMGSPPWFLGIDIVQTDKGDYTLKVKLAYQQGENMFAVLWAENEVVNATQDRLGGVEVTFEIRAQNKRVDTPKHDWSETRTLPCGCVLPWNPKWFEKLQEVGPGEPIDEKGVFQILMQYHVCPKRVRPKPPEHTSH